MTKPEKKKQEKTSANESVEGEGKNKNETPEEKLNTTQEKLLRAMAEIENQRRRFEKEKQEAFDFRGFNVAAESLYPKYLSDDAKSIKKAYCVPPHKGIFN